MPFKTKKKKQHATKNRISLNESGFLTYASTSNSSEHVQDQSYKSLSKSDAIDGNDYIQRKKELARIFLLSSVIIGLQLALKASNLSLFK